MTTKAYSRMPVSTARPAGVRVARNKWAEVAHLSDEEILAKGIPMRMIKRLRRKSDD
jgi:hypothetical protein